MLRSAVIVAFVVGISNAVVSTQAAEPTVAVDELFGLTQLHRMQLTVAADDYPRMDPPSRGFGGPAARPPAVAPEAAGAGNFGFEFEYVPAELQIGDETFKDIGLRYKGSGTYLMSQRQAKRSFKIDFDRNDPEQTFHGYSKLSLNSGVMDTSKAREALAYALFRAAGVPAPRTAFAEVALTVPGKFDRECLGLYAVVEQVDTQFLKTHFGDGKGLLLKPEGIRGLPHLGDDPAAYETVYNVKSKPGRGDGKRLVELTRLINKADEAEFREQIGDYLDVGAFVRFLAVNTLLASLDGFIGMGHNYYLYLSPETGKFAFIPWDLDLAFGAFTFYGNPEQLADLSLDHPHLGENKLIDRLLAMPDVKQAYRNELKRIAGELFTVEKLGAQLAEIEALAKEPLTREREAAKARKEGGGFGPSGGAMFASLPLDAFIAKRTASVAAQLAGEKTCYVPRLANFGPPGGFGAPPLAKPLLESLDANKDGRSTDAEFTAGMQKLFTQWDTNKNGELDEREIAAGLRTLTPAGPSR